MEKEITRSNVGVINLALTNIKKAHDYLCENEQKKAAKKLYTRTHLISFVPLAYEADNTETLAEFIKWFFTPEKRSVSISKVYNAHCSCGSNSAYAVEMRDRELRNYYKEFVGGGKNETN